MNLTNKLVYLGDSKFTNLPENKVPVFGEVYTVMAVDQYNNLPMPYLVLEEMGMPYSYPLYEFVLEQEYSSMTRQLGKLLEEAKIIFEK